MPAGTFPKEFRDSAFGKPDKPFIAVLVPVLIILCGITLFMSLQEAPVTSDKQIVKIQNRYAKLVLDAFEIEKRKKKKEKEKPSEPKIVKPVEIPKPKKEVPSVEKEKKIEIPKVIEVKSKKYDIRKEKVEIVQLEKEVKIDTLPDLPDVLDKKNNRYGSRKDSGVIGLDPDKDTGFNLSSKGPDIDVSRSSRYGGAGRSRKGLDFEEDKLDTLKSSEPSIDTRTIKRYKSKKNTAGTGSGSLVADMGERKIVLAKREPEPKVVVGKRYGGGSYKKGIPPREKVVISEKNSALKKSGNMISLPETANIQNLEACVDPNEEKRLKKKIVTYVGDAGVCSDKWGTYGYIGTEMFSTLEVRFVSSKNRKYNRCEALNRALQCLINKNKR